MIDFWFMTTDFFLLLILLSTHPLNFTNNWNILWCYAFDYAAAADVMWCDMMIWSLDLGSIQAPPIREELKNHDEIGMGNEWMGIGWWSIECINYQQQQQADRSPSSSRSSAHWAFKVLSSFYGLFTIGTSLLYVRITKDLESMRWVWVGGRKKTAFCMHGGD